MFLGKILAGGLLLVIGRKLFWLYVGILGFVAGLTVSERLFHVQPEWVQLLVGIGLGILGALLAYFFQEIAIAVAGFFAGAYVASGFSNVLAANAAAQNGDVLNWILFIVGGLLGAFLAVMVFDWALIILTSVTGAMLVVEGLSIAAPWAFWSMVGLAVVGVIIQAGIEPPRYTRHREITTPHTS